MKLRQVRKNYSKWKKKAEDLSKYLKDNFSQEQQNEKVIKAIHQENNLDKEIGEMFAELTGPDSFLAAAT